MINWDIKTPIITKYEVPYLCGYPVSGPQIYVDRRIQRMWQHGGKSIDIFRYIIIHEEVERYLEQMLGMKYADAHAIATAAERKATQLDGVDWDTYAAHWSSYLPTTMKQFTNPPPDLDLQPYKDNHDQTIYNKLVQLGVKP